MSTKPTGKQGICFAGIPTAPDIKRLCDHWPPSQMSEGNRMEYADVESVIQCKRKSLRYVTITAAWRRQIERETGIIIGTVKGEAFLVLNDSEKLEMSGGKIKSAVRHVRRGYQVAALTNRKRLSSEEANRLDHLQHIAVRIQETARLASRAQLPEL